MGVGVFDLNLQGLRGPPPGDGRLAPLQGQFGQLLSRRQIVRLDLGKANQPGRARQMIPAVLVRRSPRINSAASSFRPRSAGQVHCGFGAGSSSSARLLAARFVRTRRRQRLSVVAFSAIRSSFRRWNARPTGCTCILGCWRWAFSSSSPPPPARAWRRSACGERPCSRARIPPARCRTPCGWPLPSTGFSA